MFSMCRSLFQTVHREPHKRATLFLIITLAFLSRFLYFYQWKQKEILYKDGGSIERTVMVDFKNVLLIRRFSFTR